MNRRRASLPGQPRLADAAVAAVVHPGDGAGGDLPSRVHRRAQTAVQPRGARHVDGPPHRQPTRMGHVGGYVERASGKDIDGRPELQKLLNAAARGEFDVVPVMKRSRRLVGVMSTVEFLDEYGVKFKSATEPFGYTVLLGEMMLQLLAIFAEFERALILERIQNGIVAKLATGITLTSRVGYGLCVDDDGKLAADAATIGIVKRIFSDYIERQLGTRAIAYALNDADIPGPSRRGWSADSVSRVLPKRAFIGDIRHKDKWLPGAHEPLIHVELFNAAAAVLDQRASDSATAASARGDHLLTGTLECARCSANCVGRGGTSGTGGSYRYYVCGMVNKHGSGRGCDAPHLPATELEDLVTDALLDVDTDSALFAEAIATQLGERQVREQPLREHLAAARAALGESQRVRQRYQDDYETGRLSAERYDTRAAELDEQRRRCAAPRPSSRRNSTWRRLPPGPGRARRAARRARHGCARRQRAGPQGAVRLAHRAHPRSRLRRHPPDVPSLRPSRREDRHRRRSGRGDGQCPRSARRAGRSHVVLKPSGWVELRGLEPLTPCMPCTSRPSRDVQDRPRTPTDLTLWGPGVRPCPLPCSAR